jgi:acyl-CoA synthetase (NDP forming)
MFAPHSVAVVGATVGVDRMAGRPVKCIQKYFSGALYPVNPRYDEIDGLGCWPSLSALPETPDLVAICTRAEQVPAIAVEAAQCGVKALVVFAVGFAEAGPQGIELQNRLDQIRIEYGIRILGPNSSGYRNVYEGLPVCISRDPLHELPVGPIAVLGQSGSLVQYLSQYPLHQRGTAAGFIVDTGNQLDVDLADCAEFARTLPEVRAVGLIPETFPDGQSLVTQIERLVDSGRRVAILQLGQSAKGRAAVGAHVGRLGSSAAVFRGLAQDAGAFWCADERQFTEFLSSSIVVGATRRRVAAIASSGGVATLIADQCARYGVDLPPVVPDNPSGEWSQIKEVLPLMTGTNPIDASGPSTEHQSLLPDLISAVGHSAELDAVVVWSHLSLSRPDTSQKYMSLIQDAAARSPVPLVLCGAINPADAARLRNVGVSSHQSVTDAICALGSQESVQLGDVRYQRDDGGAVEVLAIHEALQLLQRANITVAPFLLANSVEQVLEFADNDTDRPCCLKVNSVTVSHKRAAGGVYLDLYGEEQIRRGWERLVNAFPNTSSILVQRQYRSPCELFAGVIRTDDFGDVVAFGWGGSHIELLGDVSFLPTPTTSASIAKALSALRIATVLRAENVFDDAVAAILQTTGLTRLLSKGYQAIEINPFMATENGFLAVDCHAIVDSRVR